MGHGERSWTLRSVAPLAPDGLTLAKKLAKGKMRCALR